MPMMMLLRLAGVVGTLVRTPMNKRLRQVTAVNHSGYSPSPVMRVRWDPNDLVWAADDDPPTIDLDFLDLGQDGPERRLSLTGEDSEGPEHHVIRSEELRVITGQEDESSGFGLFPSCGRGFYELDDDSGERGAIRHNGQVTFDDPPSGDEIPLVRPEENPKRSGTDE